MAKTIELVCMRLAEMHINRIDQDNSRVCSKCGERVGIYPSGQKVLKKHPHTAIICNLCAGPDIYGRPAPGAIEEARGQRGE